MDRETWSVVRPRANPPRKLEARKSLFGLRRTTASKPAKIPSAVARACKQRCAKQQARAFFVQSRTVAQALISCKQKTMQLLRAIQADFQHELFNPSSLQGTNRTGHRPALVDIFFPRLQHEHRASNTNTANPANPATRDRRNERILWESPLALRSADRTRQSIALSWPGILRRNHLQSGWRTRNPNLSVHHRAPS